MTVARSLGGGSKKGGGDDSCVAESEHPERSPSSCGMAYSWSSFVLPQAAWRLFLLSAPPLILGGWGRWGHVGNRPSDARRSGHPYSWLQRKYVVLLLLLLLRGELLMLLAALLLRPCNMSSQLLLRVLLLFFSLLLHPSFWLLLQLLLLLQLRLL